LDFPTRRQGLFERLENGLGFIPRQHSALLRIEQAHPFQNLKISPTSQTLRRSRNQLIRRKTTSA
jgi:hypothetical protein